MKFRLVLMLSLAVFMVSRSKAQPETSAQPVIADSANFIRAYLMVAQPYHRYPQCAFGHAFLRMVSDEAGLDYCFSMESGNYEGLLDICLGHYPNRMAAVPTADYLKSFNAEGRAVTAWPLNITLPEGQRLWQRLDETSAAGQSPYHDFFHHGCSQEIVSLLAQSLDGHIVFGDSARHYEGTTFTLGNRLLPSNSWMHIPPSMLTAIEGSDRPLSDMDKTAFPVLLPALFADAAIEGSDGSRRPFFKPGVAPDSILPSGQPYVCNNAPIVVWFGLLLAVTVAVAAVGLLARSRRAQQCARAYFVALGVCYVVVALALGAISQFSTLPTLHGWNWNLLVYNLVPLLVWLVARVRPFGQRAWQMVHVGYAVWIGLFMAAMWLWGGHQIREQYLLATTFAVGALYWAFS